MTQPQLTTVMVHDMGEPKFQLHRSSTDEERVYFDLGKVSIFMDYDRLLELKHVIDDFVAPATSFHNAFPQPQEVAVDADEPF